MKKNIIIGICLTFIVLLLSWQTNSKEYVVIEVNNEGKTFYWDRINNRNVSYSTLQEAMNTLASNGFVYKGTSKMTKYYGSEGIIIMER